MPEIEPVGATEIAAMASVNRATVEQWTRRHTDFPKPRWTVGGRPAYDRSEVAEWLESSGRVAVQHNDRNRDRNQQRNRSYAHGNPDVAWPLVHGEVAVYEQHHGVIGGARYVRAITEDIVVQWVAVDPPRGMSLLDFSIQYLRQTVDLYGPDPAARWREHVAALPQARPPVRPRADTPRYPIGRLACIGLAWIARTSIAWTHRACDMAGAWHIAALSDHGLIERDPAAPLTLRVTPLGQEVLEALNVAGFDQNGNGWDRALRNQVRTIIASSKTAPGQEKGITTVDDTYNLDNLVSTDADMRDALWKAGVEIDNTHPDRLGEVTFEIPTSDGEGIVLGGEPCDDDADAIWWVARRHGRDEFLYEGTDMDACVAAIVSAVR